MVFVTIARNTYSTREECEGNIMWDIGTILTFLAICFQTLKEACSLANVQHKVLNKSLLGFINILVRVY
jgi:hypothetical protein